MFEAKLQFTKSFDDSVFYNYEIGGYSLCFTQFLDNGQDKKKINLVGCIFQVSIHELNREFPTLFVGVSHPCGDYPSVYECANANGRVSLEKIDDYIKKLEYAKEVLGSVKCFFENSEHKKLYDKRKELED